MHLVPAERAGRRIIDQEKVCEAIDSLGDPVHITTCAQRFAAARRPHPATPPARHQSRRPISVSDLAVAVGLTDATASQTLRYLRASGTVATQRDGRIIRYQLHDPAISELLDYSTP